MVGWPKRMKLKLVLTASILLDLVLAGWLMLLLCTPKGQPAGAAAINDSHQSAASAPQRRGTAKAAPLPASPSRVAPFDWRQVESEDYRQYLANLRAIGCPEKTIKDIVVADVNDLFASRMASITKTNQYHYWRNEPVTRSEEQERQLRDLYAEKREVLKTLGFDAPDFTDLVAEAFRDKSEEIDLQLAFLPELKRLQVRAALLQQEQQKLAVGNDVAQSNAIEEQAQNQIRSLLTPEEFNEYDLRSSMNAMKLRAVLDPLAGTEQEFRAIFDSWRNLKAIRPGTPDYLEAQQANETALQQLLGPDRFKLYLEGVKAWGIVN